VLGTLGGRTARALLAAAFGKDSPAALIEDAVAILAALLIMVHTLETTTSRAITATFAELKAPVKRVCGLQVVIHYSPSSTIVCSQRGPGR
jgi:hypothetical protein